MRFIENATDYNEGIVLAGIADRYGPCVGALTGPNHPVHGRTWCTIFPSKFYYTEFYLTTHQIIKIDPILLALKDLKLLKLKKKPNYIKIIKKYSYN